MVVGKTPGGSGTMSNESLNVDDPLYIHPTNTITRTRIGFTLLGTKNFIKSEKVP